MRQNPGQPLPPILPIVLYHGPQSWSAPTASADMFDQEVVLNFGALQPTAQFIKRFGALSDGQQDRFDALDPQGLASIYDLIFTADSGDALLEAAQAAQAAPVVAPA